MNKAVLILIIFCTCVTFSKAQIQKGVNINGEAAGDVSGFSVSMPDANTLAIGACGNDGNGNNAGHVRIYSWNGNSWVQKGADIDGEAAGDQSGYSISMPDVNTLAIGANLNDGNGNYSGHVRIYSWNGSAWVQKGVDIDGEFGNDNSGYSVSMPDANTLAIGAQNNNGTGSDAGNVRIFRWNGSAWVQKGADIDGETAGDFSGTSVSMPDANTLAIGACGNDGNGNAAGHVRIYSWNGSAWVQKGTDIDGEAAFDYLGWFVSMPDANTIAIGAYGNDGNGSEAGHVRVYFWSGGVWVQKGADIDGEAAGDQSGYSISMPDTNTLAIGANLNDGNGNAAGHVRIYSWNGSNWVQKGTDINGEAVGDQSGYSISMPDANTLAIGARLNDGNGSNAGHVRVFDLCNSANTISPTVCNSSYTSPSGNYTWTTSGIYKDTIPNAAGCDSIIKVNLSINVSTSSSQIVSACNSYSWNSNTYTVSGTYMDTIPNVSGCDSMMTLNLTVNPLPIVTLNFESMNVQCVSVSSISLWGGSPAGGTYSGTAVSGGVFSPSAAGTGSFVITYTYADSNSCIDNASAFIYVDVCTGINQINDKLALISIYPNPTNGVFSIKSDAVLLKIKITNILGETIRDNVSHSCAEKGIYFLDLITERGEVTKKIIVQ